MLLLPPLLLTQWHLLLASLSALQAGRLVEDRAGLPAGLLG